MLAIAEHEVWLVMFYRIYNLLNFLFSDVFFAALFFETFKEAPNIYKQFCNGHNQERFILDRFFRLYIRKVMLVITIRETQTTERDITCI